MPLKWPYLPNRMRPKRFRRADIKSRPVVKKINKYLTKLPPDELWLVFKNGDYPPWFL